MRSPLVIALLIVAVGGANADDTIVSRVGGTAKMIKGHPTIRMVREHVRIEPVSGKVVATFIFKNEGPNQTVLIGFPETDYIGKAPYKDFWSSVDGKPVGVTPITGSFGKDQKGRYWTKRVSFEKGQTREVMVGYFGGKGEVSDGQRFMSYILKSGAAWKGTIGQVRIDCDLTKLKYADIFEYSIDPDKVTPQKATWLIRNWEPDDDWKICWYPGFSRFTSNNHNRLDKLRYWRHGGLGEYPARFVGDDVLVPVQSLANVLGAKITRGQTGLSIEDGKTKVTCSLGSKRVWTDKGLAELKHRPRTINGCTYIPLAKMLRLFGVDAYYNKEARTLQINFPPEQTKSKA